MLHLLNIGNLEEACPFKEKYCLNCCWITHILLFRHRASIIVTERKTDRVFDFKEWFHISADQYCKKATCLLGDAILVSVLVKANRTKRLQTSPCDELETSRLIFFSSEIPTKKRFPIHLLLLPISGACWLSSYYPSTSYYDTFLTILWIEPWFCQKRSFSPRTHWGEQLVSLNSTQRGLPTKEIWER